MGIVYVISATCNFIFSQWNMLLYSVYIKIFLAQKGPFVSSGPLQTPPCLIEKASPSRDLRTPRSPMMSWRPGRGCRCRGWWGRGRPGARTASCPGRTRCSSRRRRGARGPSATRATRRRTAAAVKREILVKVIQLVSLLASFNFLKVSSFSDPDGVGFQDWTLIEKDLLLFTTFFGNESDLVGQILVIQLKFSLQVLKPFVPSEPPRFGSPPPRPPRSWRRGCRRRAHPRARSRRGQTWPRPLWSCRGCWTPRRPRVCPALSPRWGHSTGTAPGIMKESFRWTFAAFAIL